jgi:predicted transcriptional regulator
MKPKGSFVGLSEVVVAEIRKLSLEGMPPADVARLLGIGTSSVSRYKQQDGIQRSHLKQFTEFGQACSACKIEKSFAEFTPHKSSKSGYGYRCKTCRKSAENPIQKLATKRRSLAHRFSGAKAQAKARGIGWSLTKEEFSEINSHMCFYCEYALPEFGAGIDRCDSDLSYCTSNVVPCCTTCNRIKSNRFSKEEMLLIGKTIKAIQFARSQSNLSIGSDA